MLEVAPLKLNWTLERNGQHEVDVIEDKENNNKKSTAAVKKNVTEVEEGKFIIKPTNNYMQKCAGCGGNFANTDVCLMATKLRLIRGEKSPMGKERKQMYIIKWTKNAWRRGLT
ncbi:uncharacterized protein LOC130655468 [Hydractinia symbiolongicarpus]|uniref:uncharacterized protein LOC130655468 n=1 Tax=Hydractinia symbiolongicarpus TaxID=13093 RepID=UPI00254CD7EB|nr:uncharacterized protein LOC130655468 [Hydractinia symbiolongicarpus]